MDDPEYRDKVIREECEKAASEMRAAYDELHGEPASTRVREDDEARVHREVLQQIAAMPTVQRNPDGDDQAAATMKLLAQEALDWPASAAPPILKGEDE